jgi:acetoin utilization deacetylase AcuC-like enzyme
MAVTGYVYDERYLLHDPGSWHVERSDRLRAIQKRLVVSGLIEELICLQTFEAPVEWIEKLHDPEYLARFQRACGKGLPILDTGDCGICPKTFEIARLAVGGVLAACDAMMAGVVTQCLLCGAPSRSSCRTVAGHGILFF